MRKVGIITFFGEFNYGNRLQNYAVQEIMKDFGMDVVTIKDDNSIKPKSLIIIIRNLLSSLKNIKLTIKENKKRRKFREFNKKYINFFDGYITEENAKEFDPKFDFFVTGSDQVWNPYYSKCKNYYFLTFCNPDKRICFSPSIGLNELPLKFISVYHNYLSDYNSVSVRENEGAEIIKTLVDIPVKVLPDPTLVLDKYKWEELASKSKLKIANKKYILTYFLGDIDIYRNKILGFSKQYNLEVINIYNLEDLKYYDVGPEDFVFLIKNASLVLTDSFHGTVFSIIFKTPFISYDRVDKDGNMNSRIKTLLGKYDLNHRFQLKTDPLIIDWKNTDNIIKEQRKETISYINSIINQFEFN